MLKKCKFMSKKVLYLPRNFTLVSYCDCNPSKLRQKMTGGKQENKGSGIISLKI